MTAIAPAARVVESGIVARALTMLRWVVPLVPAAVFVLCSLSADLVATFGGDPLGVWQVLPAGPVTGDWASAELSSTAFLLVGIALARRKRAGFWLGMAAMAGALIVQGVSLDRPVAAGAAAIVAAILLLTRGRYDVGTSRRDGMLAAGLVALGSLIAGVAAIEVAGGHDVGRILAETIGVLFDAATPVAVPGLAALGALAVVARIGYVVATMLALDPVRDNRSVEAIAAARRTLRQLGEGSLLPYQRDPSCMAFADARSTAAIAVASVGRTAVTLGDPAGDPAGGRAVFDAWAERCRRDDLVPVVYQASSGAAERLRATGWRACLVGREAVIDPVAFDLRSPRSANLRHTVSRSRRGGISTVWSANGIEGLGDTRLATKLSTLDEAWRRKAGPQLGFTVGRFDPRDGNASAVAAAVDEAGDPVAFIVLRPTGADGGWMLDLMRRTSSGVPGAVEACMVAAIEALGAMGVHRLSLGLAPLNGLDPSTGPLPERALAVGAKAIRPLYDHVGLAFFKGKFDPVWEPRYLVVRSWWDLLPAVIALLRLHLGGGWPRVVRSLVAGVVPAR